nr:hypothetical protein [Tanacetum cinerariifolium]
MEILPESTSNSSAVASEEDELPSCIRHDSRARRGDGFFGDSVRKLATSRLIDGSSCDGIDMIKILHDVAGTSGYRCRVLQSFPLEITEQGNE